MDALMCGRSAREVLQRLVSSLGLASPSRHGFYEVHESPLWCRSYYPGRPRRTWLLAAAFWLPLARKPTTLLPALPGPWPLVNALLSVQGMLHVLRSELATLAPTSTAQEPPPASKNLARQASPALWRLLLLR